MSKAVVRLRARSKVMGAAGRRMLLVGAALACLDACSPVTPVGVTTEDLRLTTRMECPWVGADVRDARGSLRMHYENPATVQPGLQLVGTDLAFPFYFGGRDYVLFGDTGRGGGGGAMLADDSYAQLIDLDPCPRLSFPAQPSPTGAEPVPLRVWWPVGGSYLEVPMGANQTPVGGFSDGTSAWAMVIGRRPCASDGDCATGDTCGAGTCIAGAGSGGPYPRSMLGYGRFWYPPHSWNHVVLEGWLSAREWQTTAARAVPRFDPADPLSPRYFGAPNVPDGVAASMPALFVWGRPAFASSIQQPTYLAYYDLRDSGARRWDPWYFVGTDATGRPRWRRGSQTATTFADAVPVVSAASESIEGAPILANGQMSVSWVPDLERWIMIYGGRPPLVDSSTLFADDRTFGIYFRLSPHPWGPWSPPMRLWDANTGGFYSEGGPMYHPVTNASMQNAGEWPVDSAGAEYGVGIFDRLTAHAPHEVTIRWAMSLWHPYRVVMMSTTFAF